ncbi:TOMM precursor leader peptide-binding protein [Solwaraspora sp. WMMD1047]|uniref:TOMM precursor leader peptide-binding protein n=1 Tax=Solwaraspora sp. WMMD1047 TaxID=3016102 RepID=UPI0024173464|nr:TOMM precursor leader peptide-binding protein [Solwaraspora sp. WMMD1047]MDG4832107.1 TOMM precursor leader peptide-binding protein [Solwaraspora sp. WMMD1047]
MTDQQLTDKQPATTGGDARPRLRGDVIWLRSDEGVYVRSAQSAMLLRGSSTYRLMSAISPYLTGEHSLGELCAGLPRTQSAAVANLVGALLDRGMAHDLRRSTQRELPAPLADRFADQLAFLGHFADDPVDQFLAYRTARVVVLGTGHALHAVATGLLGNGLGALRLAGAAVTDPHRPAIESTAAALRATVELTGTPTDADLTDVDLLVYCADETDLALVARLAEQSRAAGVRFLPAVLRGRRALLGPLVGPDRAGCWTCAQLRLAANDPPELAADTWRSIALGPVTPDRSAPTETVRRMIGNAAAFDVFRELTAALPPDTRGAVLVQDALTLEAGVAPVIAHPRCPTCAGSGLRAAPAAADETDESRYERLSALVDHRTGPFAEFTDDPLRQSPLPTGRLRVASPAGPDEPIREFVGFDVQTVLRARLSAARTAVGHYADRLAAVPVRVGRAADLDAPAVGADRLGTWAGLRAPGPDEPTGWVPAVSLLTGEPRYVPAGAVFPASRWNGDLVFEAGPAGLGVGADAEAAADAGLLTALAYRALDRMLRGAAAVAALDPDALPDGADRLPFLRDCLRHLGHSPTLRLIEDGPVPVVLASLAPPADPDQPDLADQADQPDRVGWRVGVAGDRAGAVREALTLLLGGAQLDAYHGGAGDLGDPLVADLPPVIAATAPPAGEAAPADRATILRHLAELDHDALFAATTPADLASVGGFHTGRVLLAGPAGDRPDPRTGGMTG